MILHAHEAIDMKVLKLGNYILVIYALYQYLDTTKLTTKLPTPLPLTRGVMSSSSSTLPRLTTVRRELRRPASAPERPAPLRSVR